MSEQKIKLYKQRDFSQKMNVTIDYIRNEFGKLIKAVLIIAIPFSLIYALVMASMFDSFGEMVNNPGANPEDMMANMSQVWSNQLITMVMFILTYSFLIATIFTYMKERDQDRYHEPLALIKLSARSVPGLIGLMFLITLVSGVGMVFFIIPGIYLMVTLSLAAPIFVFEDISVSDAFSKSFKLIKGKWWSTFGLLIVSGLIAVVITYLFAIPTYLLMFGDLFSDPSALKDDPGGMFDNFSTWYGSLISTLTTIGAYCTYLIPIIALSFQYFNLSERKEGTGLKQQIQDFENLG